MARSSRFSAAAERASVALLAGEEVGLKPFG